MAFNPKGGRWKTIWSPVTPSTALPKRSLVRFTSGKLTASVAATPAVDNFGILDKVIVAADLDYAVDRLVPVLVPTERHAIVEADVTSGLVATDVGTEVDLTDGSTVDRSASSIKAVKVLRRISATKGQFMVKFNGAY